MGQEGCLVAGVGLTCGLKRQHSSSLVHAFHRLQFHVGANHMGKVFREHVVWYAERVWQALCRITSSYPIYGANNVVNFAVVVDAPFKEFVRTSEKSCLTLAWPSFNALGAAKP